MSADILSLSHIKDRVAYLAECRRVPLMTLLTELLDLVWCLGSDHFLVQTHLKVILAQFCPDLYLEVGLILEKLGHVVLNILLDPFLLVLVIILVFVNIRHTNLLG